MKKLDVILIFFVFMVVPSNGKCQNRYASVFADICSTLKIETAKVSLKEVSTGIAYCSNFENHQAIIYYNAKEFARFPISYFVGVMCHELGHFMNEDKVGCDSVAEGNADLYAGYALRKMNLDIHSSLLYLKIYKNASVKCYPDQAKRESLVNQGWNRMDKELVDKNGYNLLVPRITWTITNNYQLEVNIGDRQLSFSDWKEKEDVVVIYDSVSTSTIQLLDYRFKANNSGLGRQITSQGLYSYFIYPKVILNGYNYMIFYKGKVMRLADCDQENKREGQDLIVRCQDQDNGNVEVGFRLVDYFLAPNKYVLPAVYQ
ncbi:hypothetical protein [Sphingobacterium multivorum]|uniref:hypothetical protein n=1 Tax=Sphingobacterium multivorum TaxID=28454 RepID=UPI00345E808B